MLARFARLYGQRDLKVEEAPVAGPGAGQVLLKMAAGGICGSDLHLMNGFVPTMCLGDVLGGVAGPQDAGGHAHDPRVLPAEHRGEVGAQAVGGGTGDRHAVPPSDPPGDAGGRPGERGERRAREEPGMPHEVHARGAPPGSRM